MRRGYYAEAGLSGGPEMLGMSVVAGSRAAGEALPAHTHTGTSEHPLHPDSAMFWLILFTVGAVFGIAGASVQARARLFKGKAGAGVEVGST